MEKRYDTRIVAAHSGTGKTTFAREHDDVLDFVCMPYKYHLPEGEVSYKESEASKASFHDMRDEWPFNYYEALIEAYESGKYDIILVVPDLYVLTMLFAAKVPYTLVYPDRSLKDEYAERFEARGNNEEFMSIFIGRWDAFMDDFEAAMPTERIILQSGQYIGDAIETRPLGASSW